MARLLIIFLSTHFLIPLGIRGQEVKSNEIIAEVDNDQFNFKATDKYYSNGISLSWNRVISNTGFPNIKGIGKKMIIGSLRHKIYTPSEITFYESWRHDRPYASTLTMTGGLRLFFGDNQCIQSDVTVGVAGPMALGQKLQEWWHDQIDVFEPRGWENQIVNNPIIELHLLLTQQWFNHQYFDFISTSELNFGSLKTSIRQSGKFRIGNPQRLNISAYSGGNLGVAPNNSKTEIFLFAGAGIEYVNYNGLIEGNWIGEESPHTREIVPWIFHGEYGIQISTWLINTTFSFHHLSREVENSFKHQYASIKLGIRF